MAIATQPKPSPRDRTFSQPKNSDAELQSKKSLLTEVLHPTYQSRYKPAAKPVIEAEVKPAPITAAEQTGFDWCNVPNAELNGDRRHDAYIEKLRRSVEAVEQYNEGLDDSEKFAITGSLLRQITGVKPGKVKLWMDEHQAELDTDNAGFGARQNTGKPDPRSVIKWNEQAYGAYEW